MTSEVPSNEKLILQKLMSIRSQLSTLKQDRSTFIKSSDINELYEQVIEQIRKINFIRSDPHLEKEQNRVDVVLDDVFQLLSLSFLTVGMTRSLPATFASLSTVQRLLEHLNESSAYSDSDITPIRSRLDEIKAIVANNPDEESPEVILLIRQKINICDTLLRDVQESMATISSDLEPIFRQLISIRRQIMSIGSRPQFNQASLKPLKEELRNIESKKIDGHFLSPDGGIPNGQGVVNGLLEDCYVLINDFSASGEHVSESLKPIYKQLVEMKSTLESLLVTHRWTLRETDLYTFQKRLHEIDDMRVKGKFLDSDGNAAKGQAILLYLVRRCYAIIYKLLESSEPVSEALIPMHNQLTTVRRCLLEVKRMGGLSSTRELYPYQMKLASIDNLRVDGKFMVGGTIPEGQGMLNALLAECFDICHELKVEMEENEE